MRIISGLHKGRRFSPPTNITARPTTDFAKEGLFNLLFNRLDFETLHTLDLFSGTGSISYELASRGCIDITSIEMSERHVAYIKKMIQTLKIDNMRVLRTDVFRYMERCRSQFDFVFADPPYQLPNLETIPDLVFEHKLLTEGGLLVVEHGATTNFESHPHCTETRHYGNVYFSFFE